MHARTVGGRWERNFGNFPTTPFIKIVVILSVNMEPTILLFHNIFHTIVLQ